MNYSDCRLKNKLRDLLYLIHINCHFFSACSTFRVAVPDHGQPVQPPGYHMMEPV